VLGNMWSWELQGVPVELLGGSVGSGFKRGTSSSAAALRRPLALMLRRASSLARATKARVGSSGAGREARGAQTVPGSNGQGSSPGGANGGMVVLVLTRERVGMAFIVGREAVTVFLALQGK
jgi:hypothetical protein